MSLKALWFCRFNPVKVNYGEDSGVQIYIFCGLCYDIYYVAYQMNIDTEGYDIIVFCHVNELKK